MLNKQGEGKINYCDYTWNPISGCLNTCSYCYMRRMEKRFPGIMAPKIKKNYLADPVKLKKPSVIFVGSSGDMWGDWVKTEDIDDVLDVCHLAPQHTYLFLTKNPRRYGDFKTLPNNAFYGTTVDGTARTENNIYQLASCTPLINKTFVSFEPLINEVELPGFGFNWIIIGADSTKGAAKPPKEWADKLIDQAGHRNVPVFVKDNYGYPRIIRETPFFKE